MKIQHHSPDYRYCTDKKGRRSNTAHYVDREGLRYERILSRREERRPGYRWRAHERMFAGKVKNPHVPVIDEATRLRIKDAQAQATRDRVERQLADVESRRKTSPRKSRDGLWPKYGAKELRRMAWSF